MTPEQPPSSEEPYDRVGADARLESPHAVVVGERPGPFLPDDGQGGVVGIVSATAIQYIPTEAADEHIEPAGTPTAAGWSGREIAPH